MREIIDRTTFIIKDGPNFNQTYASVRFDRWGKTIPNIDIQVVNDWSEIKTNVVSPKEWIFLLKSGSMFDDIIEFFDNLDPALLKTGLGHITTKNDNEVYLNDMACLIRFKDFTLDPVKEFPNFELSTKNIHHDYTPLSVKRTNGYKKLTENKFGQSIIARHLEQYEYFNNFPSKLRKFKVYNYEGKSKIFSDYIDLAENTLWIFNNEELYINENKKVLMPGAGVWPLFQRCEDFIHVNDISKVQCKFLEECSKKWNGINYGKFVYDFIVKNRIKHYHINLNEQQKRDRTSIKDKHLFCKIIDDNFEMLWKKYGKGDWLEHWQKQKSKIKVENKNILESRSRHNYHLNDVVLSNIFDFKYNYATNYIDKWKHLMALSTKAFISNVTKNEVDKSKHSPKTLNKEFVDDHYSKATDPTYHYNGPPCQELVFDIPVEDIHEEIHNARHHLKPYRENHSFGWRSLCIHGQSMDRTGATDAYDDFLGWRWTEAQDFMPKTVKWLKSLPLKNYERVRVMCLDPKGFIDMHVDRKVKGLGPINVAITQPENCDFYMKNYGKVDFKPGKAFMFDVSNMHAVVNNSNIPRYHIIIHHNPKYKDSYPTRQQN